MPLNSFSLDRKLTSYTKVQRLVGSIVRNRRYQLRRLKDFRYLDLGCGPNTHSNFINTDFLWHPGINLCWDITRGLPLADNCLNGIFSEHCLEHFPLKTACFIMQECHRLLRPGGVFRIVVPDAELYLTTYARAKAGDVAACFPYDVSFQGLKAPALDVNRVFYQDRSSPYGHWFIYDYEVLEALLRQIGFTSVSRQAYGKGGDPHLLIDTESRSVESLYVEAVR